jgi:hypothetical protein
MKIKITEQQFRNLTSEKTKKLLLEQDLMGYVEQGISFLDKNLGRPISKWADDMWYGKGNRNSNKNKYSGLQNGYLFGEKLPLATAADRKYIWNDTKRAFSEVPEIPESSLKLVKYVLDGKNWSEVVRGFEEGLVGTLTEKSVEEHFKDIAAGFNELIKYWDKEIIQPVVDFAVECSKDIHCLVDMASIAVLAIPGIGLALSAAIDIGHAGWYGVEYLNAKTPEEKSAALLAGGLTLFGGFMGGGVGQTRRIIKEANVNKNIYKYTDEVFEIAKDGEKFTDAELKLKQKELADKYKLTPKELETATELISETSKIDPKLVEDYTNAINAMANELNTVQRAELKKLMLSKEFEPFMKSSNNNTIDALNKYLKNKAKKEAILEGTLFFALTKALEIPEVQKFIKDTVSYFKYKDRKDIRGRVEKEGYNWEGTKKAFGAISTKDAEGNPNKDFTNAKSLADNGKLENAWNKGWRPYKRGIEKPTEKDLEYGIDWLKKPENEKYRTDTFKKYLKTKEILDKGMDTNKGKSEEEIEIQKQEKIKNTSISSEEKNSIEDKNDKQLTDFRYL